MDTSVIGISNPMQSVSCAVCGWKEHATAVECGSCGSPFSTGANVVFPVVSSASVRTETPLSPRSGQASGHEVTKDDSVSKWPLLLALAGISLCAWAWLSPGTITHPPGILIKDPPLQGDVPQGKAPWMVGATQITPLATYDIKARVLHRERYRWDAMSDLAPLDLGVGWGVMSDETNAARCQFQNSSRFLSWFWSGDGFPSNSNTCMGNMHVLPANDSVRDRLLDLVPGQLFEATGYLVQVNRAGMHAWTSSLTRTDTGDGACEIMWVESIVILP